jgi:response regulator NasT
LRTAIVVDDEPITRMDISAMLKGLGFNVLGEAGDGFDAIELCRVHKPDVVLMDVKMPVFDGITAARTIIDEEIAECVVLLTAFSDEHLISRANEVGITGYLVKPVEDRLLLPTIEVALAQSKRLRKATTEKRQTEQKLEESRAIEKAKLILSKEHGIKENEAYEMLRKMSMDKRIPISKISQIVVDNSDEKQIIQKAKQFIAKKYNCSENAAYRKIKDMADNSKKTAIEVAQSIISREHE